MYLVHRFGPSPLLYAMIAFTWIVNLHAVTRRVHSLGASYPTWPGVVIITVAYGLVLAIALGRLERVRWRWLTTAGALTYPLYLLHQRIGYTVIRNVYLAFRPPVWLLLIATAALMLVLAWAVHRLVEKPLGAYLRRVLRRSLDVMRAASVPLPLSRRSAHQPENAVPQRAGSASVP
nr:hypothetical protein GCM10020092_058710 [Actinoplanes digitatis]